MAAFAIGMEGVEGEGEAGFVANLFELELEGERHALDLHVEERGFGGGAAAFAPERGGHVEDELLFEGALRAEAAEQVEVERVEFGGGPRDRG